MEQKIGAAGNPRCFFRIPGINPPSECIHRYRLALKKPTCRRVKTRNPKIVHEQIYRQKRDNELHGCSERPATTFLKSIDVYEYS